MTSTLRLYPQNDILGVEGAVVPLFFRAGLEKGEMSGWKINISLVWVFFFFSFESKNISWFFVIRNMLGVFLDNSRSNTISP